MCNLGSTVPSLNLQQILYALGNDRLAALLEVEQELCNCIMEIMGGSDAETQLKRFLEKYDAMQQTWATDGRDLGLDFFDVGETVFNHLFIEVYSCLPASHCYTINISSDAIDI
jgi:hypothetical protein